MPTDVTMSDRVTARALGIYVHVPFCSSRCGYCDFNTYTSDELGPGATRASYAASAMTELSMARQALGDRRAATVFVGGGTPTLLGADDLVRLLAAIRDGIGLEADAEVTTEANPDSVAPGDLERLREGGFTRISFGMQSTATRVLAVLERTHTAGRAVSAVREARRAGFEHVSVDLIYGTPGETADDFARSLDAAIESGVDHVSAYSLVVEQGTRLWQRVRRGEVAMPDDDVAADRYAQADDALSAAGLEWYEISNWARPGGECHHNLGYWRGADWWGIGPGAHSHLDGRRWWNVRHPAAYARMLADGALPVDSEEALGPGERRTEQVMLGLRLREGLAAADAGPAAALGGLAARGLVDPARLGSGRVVLTRTGRLVADAVTRELLAG